MILTPADMKNAELHAEKNGTSLQKLMQNAGFELYKAVRSEAFRIMKGNVLILCGKGNNGGDGYVCADLLCKDGFNVAVANVCGKPSTELADNAYSFMSDNVKITDVTEKAVFDADIIVDAVFGTGFKGELPASVKEIFGLVNNSNSVKIACDLPSGVNAENGQVADGTVICDKTVTFHAYKLGCLLKPAVNFCGEISVCDIGISQNSADYSELEIIKIDEKLVKNSFKSRPCDAHKGSFGKASLVCGSEDYMGAAALSASSALRSGVGLAELFCEERICSSLFPTVPEAIYTSIDKKIPENAAKTVLSKKCSALLIGCGLSHCDSCFIEKIIEGAHCPIIIDADGINQICRNINVVLNTKEKAILTPHPAELSRICGVTVDEISKNRLDYAVKTANKLNCIVVSKAADTFVTDGKTVYLSTAGNTALSKGGSGDVLAGLMCGILAQKPENILSACASACYILGYTAEYLSQKASQRGILASDIIKAFPEVFKILDI